MPVRIPSMTRLDNYTLPTSRHQLRKVLYINWTVGLFLKAQTKEELGNGE